MLISGGLIPSVKYLPSQDKRQGQDTAAGQGQLTESPRQMRQTVEFLHRGVLDEDEGGRSEYSFQAHVDPANRSAISSYQDTAATSINTPDRKGRMLDIFL